MRSRIELRFGARAILTFAVVCLALSGCQKKSAADPQIPPIELDRRNPIESNPASIAEGQRLYHASDCALCHGEDGDGKGELAKDGSMNIHDWRNPASLAYLTDGELFNIIVKGKGGMLPYGDRETPEQVWQMINYIHSVSGTRITQ
jgi:mono/diheme cytochrome c family protein